jgi:RNA polymerase sigma-70 factor (ECF subfamily)
MLRLIRDTQPDASPSSDEPEAPRCRDPLQALVNKVIRGDHAAERTLLIAVGPAVLGVVRRVLGAKSLDVDDVCQEASISLLAALPTFRGECTVQYFACRIALLTALAARRRYDVQVHACECIEESEDLEDGAPSPAELIDAARRRNSLRALLAKLPLSQAEVLALHIVLGHSVEESSAMICSPVNTVRSRLRRGLATLREELGRNSRLREIIGEGHGKHD